MSGFWPTYTSIPGKTEAFYTITYEELNKKYLLDFLNQRYISEKVKFTFYLLCTFAIKKIHLAMFKLVEYYAHVNNSAITVIRTSSRYYHLM